MPESVPDSSSPSLEFERLPLIEVVARRVLQDDLPVDLGFAAAVARHLEVDFQGLEELFEFEGVQGVGLQPMGGVLGFKLESVNTGIALHVQANQLSARWSAKRRADYPRISSIRDSMKMLAAAVESVSGRSLTYRIVNLSYTSRIEAIKEGEEWRPVIWPLGDDFTPKGFGVFGQFSNIQAQTVSEQFVDTNLHFRMVMDPGTTERFFALSSGAGTWIRDLPVEEAESKVHEGLSKVFEQVLSDKAKEEYGFVR